MPTHRCLVVHSSIIWYGYNEAIGKLPKGESLNQKLAKMQRSRPDRPDAWVSAVIATDG